MSKETEAIRRYIAERDAIRNEIRMFKESFEQFEAAFENFAWPQFNTEKLTFSFKELKTVKKAVLPESYLFSEEVERAILVKSLVRRLKEQLSGFDQEELGTIVDYLEQLENAVSIAEDELFFHKKCPFVNDCLHFCADAVHAEEGSALRCTFMKLIDNDEIIV